MPQTCSCGTELVTEARFCHRCGKPQGLGILESQLPLEIAPPAPTINASKVAPPSPIGFQDPLALRIALMTGSMTAIPYLVLAPRLPLFLLWMAAGGYLAYVLYRRHSGQRPSMKSGVRLGWMQALFSFVMATVLFSMFLLVRGVDDLRSLLLSGLPHDDSRYQQIATMYKDPTLFGMAIMVAWVLVGIFAALSAMAGAALAAKMNNSGRSV